MTCFRNMPVLFVLAAIALSVSGAIAADSRKLMQGGDWASWLSWANSGDPLFMCFEDADCGYMNTGRSDLACSSSYICVTCGTEGTKCASAPEPQYPASETKGYNPTPAPKRVCGLQTDKAQKCSADVCGACHGKGGKYRCGATPYFISQYTDTCLVACKDEWKTRTETITVLKDVRQRFSVIEYKPDTAYSVSYSDVPVEITQYKDEHFYESQYQEKPVVVHELVAKKVEEVIWVNKQVKITEIEVERRCQNVRVSTGKKGQYQYHRVCNDYQKPVTRIKTIQAPKTVLKTVRIPNAVQKVIKVVVTNKVVKQVPVKVKTVVKMPSIVKTAIRVPKQAVRTVTVKVPEEVTFKREFNVKKCCLCTYDYPTPAKKG